MGFSLWGLIVSAIVLLPNLLLVALPPRTPLPRPRVPVLWAAAERVGQALCLVVPAVTAPGGSAPGWSIVVVVAVVAYLALWGRYLRTGRQAAALFDPVWRVPVPMAILPVVAFAATAAWLLSPWIAASAALLAIGHIPSSLTRARALREAGRVG
ncbi:hypothetical protein [Microbacterium lushaniae]|uniref:Uncharacterized protein n=1 Tax=Microbacterium lushaniae TaxID=2614639 RepID=A0A5J6L390_9MICO|nr:hypothetical protein [Microbacterium lushaniae]QEW02796.1 hypothetical protein F6J85_06545 [Microbacterium lushaniae]